MQIVYPSLTAGLMESYQKFRTTGNLENFINRATNQIKFIKIRWEEVLNVAKYTKNESEVAQQVRITTQSNKLNNRY